MLKRLCVLVCVALITLSCSKDDDLSSPESEPNLVEKNVEFQIFTDKSFSEDRWDDAFVKVEILLLKKDSKGEQTTIFQKIYDWAHFRDFPKAANMAVEQQNLTYNKETEVIFASYGVSTKIDGFLASEGTSFFLIKQRRYPPGSG